MTVLTVNNLPAARHGETVRCLFAIELSKQSWVIGFNTPLSEKISRRTLTGCKWERLLELIEEVRARVSREPGRAVEVVSCYGACYEGFKASRVSIGWGGRGWRGWSSCARPRAKRYRPGSNLRSSGNCIAWSWWLR